MVSRERRCLVQRMGLWLGWSVGLGACRAARANELVEGEERLPLAARVLQLEPVAPAQSSPVVTALRLHPNGQMLVAAGDDHQVRLIDVRSGKELRRLPGHQDWVGTAAFAPSGDRLATAGNDHRVLFWRLSGTRPLWASSQQEGAVSEIVFNHQGDRLAVVGFSQPLQILDAERGTVVVELQCPCRDMRAVAFSPDDRWIAGAGRNGRIRVWSTQDGRELVTIPAHQQRVRSLVFLQDGRTLVSAGEDRAVRLWSLPAGERLSELTGWPGKVYALARLADQRLAAACSDNVIRVWDLTDQRIVSQLRGHTGTVAVLDANADWLVSGSYDATIRLWPMSEVEQALATFASRRAAPSETSGASPTTQPTSVNTRPTP